MLSLTVVILTYDEEIHIARAIGSVSGFARKIYVVDSFSNDKTVDIARSLGAEVVQHAFVNQAKQLQWALDTLPIETDWILRLDADEIVCPDLAVALQEQLPRLGLDVAGVYLKLMQIFMGRGMRYGGRYPLRLLRLWRRGQGQVENRWMDEHMVVSGGRTVTISGGFIDHNLKGLAFFTEKHNRYSTREAVQVMIQRLSLYPRDDRIKENNRLHQVSVKRLIKENIYYKLPIHMAPFFLFIYRYFILCGFMDGSEGLSYHFLQGFWYRYLVGVKCLELQRAVAHLRDRDAIRAEISRLTQLEI